MSFIDKWRHRLRANLSAESARREREEEIAFHLELSRRQAQHEGLSPHDADARARRAFGNRTLTVEDARAVSRPGSFDRLSRDVRYAIRSLRRSPAYTIGAALTLAIGIGSTTAVFSIFDGLILHGVPYADAGRLYSATERHRSGGRRTPSYSTFKDWKDDAATWSSTIEGMAFVRGRGVWLEGHEGAERVLLGNVSPGFFELMRAQPFLGRTFRPDEEKADGERVVVLAFDIWRRFFNSDPAILGRIIDVDSTPARVIGVMPHGFTYPQWVGGRTGSSGLWMPISYIESTDVALSKRGDHVDSRVLVRARASADSAQVARALGAVDTRLSAVYADAKDWTRADLINERDGALAGPRVLLRILGAAVCLVLLLACVNVANLTFARGAARASELAVRSALGASRRRLVRELLTESLFVAGLSAAGGILLGTTLLRITQRLAADQIVGVSDLHVSGTMFGFAVMVSALTALAASIVPALRASGAAPADTMRAVARGATGTSSDARIRGSLVVVQLAVAVVLLVGTGLLLRSFRNVARAPLAYDPDGLVVTDVSPPARYSSSTGSLGLYRALIDRIEAIPGVTRAAFTNGGRMATSVAREGQVIRSDLGTSLSPRVNTVSTGYLATMKMAMTDGRWFTDDDMRTPETFVVNEELARELFAGEPAVGRRITALHAARVRSDFGQPVTGTIVGVVRDAPEGTTGGPANLYAPFTLDVWPWGTLYVRTASPEQAVALIRAAIRDVDPAIPESRASAVFNGVGSVRSRLDRSYARRKLVMSSIGAFAVSALIMAAIGLYSVVSYSVTRRTREVGVRVALGASRSRVVALVLREGIMLAALGIVIGCLTAMAGTKVLQSMLVGISRIDVRTYAEAAAVLFATAVVACYLPARRAAKLNPTEALRE
ncbi:MAG TPA: ADOP family duplicated permease [Gemmatimonadaceae bacterium]|nr:ADOP family duplicated permease [Gemmatimonadaceae bacterium]